MPPPLHTAGNRCRSAMLSQKIRGEKGRGGVEIRLLQPMSFAGIFLLGKMETFWRSPDIDPYGVAPSRAAPPNGDLVPAFVIRTEPGVPVAWVPVPPVLPRLVSVGVPLVGPDHLILIISYYGVRLLAEPESCGTVGPPSAVVDPLLESAAVSPESLGPAVVAPKTSGPPEATGEPGPPGARRLEPPGRLLTSCSERDRPSER